MFSLDIGDWGNIIFNLIILSFLISSFFIRAKDNFWYKIKILLIWIFAILVITITYNNRNILFKNIIPYSAYDSQDNSLTIRKSNDGHFYISLIVNNKKILFLIDTGATTTTLTLKDARKLGINTAGFMYNIPVNTANGISYGASTQIKNINIGNFHLKSLWVFISKDLSGKSLLGMNFLNQFKEYTVKQDEMILYY